MSIVMLSQSIGATHLGLLEPRARRGAKMEVEGGGSPFEKNS
jgi:hypothetical protein